ncbi:hypothetical protein [uncultured Rhodoblastus sp.]|uniref:hypothetical protein n=1 Tax=uncultured Rhodoblastus sp. TaxID=543037 RepID=UPI0025FE8716|nr:hypothetical protein [uncultured Rhodoblastus sp.]
MTKDEDINSFFEGAAEMVGPIERWSRRIFNADFAETRTTKVNEKVPHLLSSVGILMIAVVMDGVLKVNGALYCLGLRAL